MAQKCVHKGCGKDFTDENEDCLYHPGPPVFHEGQKGWKCCKPRVLTFDEFLAIPPCTTGRHSTVDDTPVPEPSEETDSAPTPAPVSAPADTISTTTPSANTALPSRPAVAQSAPTSATTSAPASAAPSPESDSDDPAVPIPPNTTCRRRGCNTSSPASSTMRPEDEKCIYHPGQPIFHEGSKGWTCCKRRVLEFDEFMRLPGCKTKPRHLFVGSGKKGKGKGEGQGENEEKVENVRHDYYQTPSTIHASLFLKKILPPPTSTIAFSSSTTISLDLHTSDKKVYKTTFPLFGAIDTESSSFKVLGTKLELELVKAEGEGRSWATLRSDERATGEIIQTGRAGRV